MLSLDPVILAVNRVQKKNPQRPCGAAGKRKKPIKTDSEMMIGNLAAEISRHLSPNCLEFVTQGKIDSVEHGRDGERGRLRHDLARGGPVGKLVAHRPEAIGVGVFGEGGALPDR